MSLHLELLFIARAIYFFSDLFSKNLKIIEEINKKRFENEMKTEYEIVSRTVGPVQGAGRPWWTWCYRHPGQRRTISRK